MTLRSLPRIAAATLLLASAGLFGQALWMRAKAAVASVLIGRSLERTLRDGRPHPPWEWADFHPVARLRVPRLGVDEPVLSNASGAALAFGLGHVDGTAGPGSHGNAAIAGHRDTTAAFLREVRIGDLVVVESPGGTRSYQVDSLRVLAAEAVEVLEQSGDDRLTLVTCWPFEGLTRSRQRLVVSARARFPEAFSPPPAASPTATAVPSR